MSRRPIRIMSPDLAMKIAAGEVVERPASAIKELIDNAVDAGARGIKIEVREAGLKLIRVTDDGIGIPAEELPLAFTRHATSKISELDDLERIATLGFRGEALPALGAVGHIEVRTRPPDVETGHRILVEHGQVMEQSVCAADRGVRITISDLFANVPARRKFVRSLRSENSQIQFVVMQYALACPDVRFELLIDERPVFLSNGTGALEDAMAAVYGADVLKHLLPVSRDTTDIAVSGLISAPALSRQNRSGISFAVNGRPVQNRSLGFALEQAYTGLLMTGRHPLAVIHLRLPSGDVDVNIHPSKSEVRFARDREVHSALHRAVATVLLDMRVEAREVSIETAVTPAPAAHPAPLLIGSDEFPAPEQAVLEPSLPVLRVFGQANQTFIIAEGPNGVYMIDQHAAHERVLFDRLDQQMAAGSSAQQALLEPAAVELAPEQMLALEDYASLLAGLGFSLEPFGDTACLIRAVPVLPRGGSPPAMVAEVLSELASRSDARVARERALAAVACRAAVKAGQTMDVQEMQELVLQLERTARPATCPHGRPTMIHLSNAQLEREFGRR